MILVFFLRRNKKNIVVFKNSNHKFFKSLLVCVRDSSGILLCSPDGNRDYTKDTADSPTRSGHAQKQKTLTLLQGFELF